ncbi:GH3 auxin-responsive promoter family protein [Streptomyces sp. AD16]|nr:GH3 auxin-responsive promoter family protein [Streptomyces sp. AD16]
MSTDPFVARLMAAHHDQRVCCREPHQVSRRVFADLLDQSRGTAFGRAHGLDRVRTLAEFQAAVPVGDYESFRGYVDRIRDGEQRVLTRSRPYALHTTSGTTGRPKYVPTTRHWRNRYRGPALYAQWGLYFQRLGLDRYRPGNVLDMSWERSLIPLPEPGGPVPVYSITKRPATVGPQDWTPPGTRSRGSSTPAGSRASTARCGCWPAPTSVWSSRSTLRASPRWASSSTTNWSCCSRT